MLNLNLNLVSYDMKFTMFQKQTQQQNLGFLISMEFHLMILLGSPNQGIKRAPPPSNGLNRQQQGVLCKGYYYQPRPKMVTNSFGKTNFMSPMGRPKHAHSRCLALFSFQIWWGKGFFFFFHFSLVPNVFALCSFQILNMFPKFPIYSPTCSPQHLTFILLSSIQVGAKGLLQGKKKKNLERHLI